MCTPRATLPVGREPSSLLNRQSWIVTLSEHACKIYIGFCTEKTDRVPRGFSRRQDLYRVLNGENKPGIKRDKRESETSKDNLENVGRSGEPCAANRGGKSCTVGPTVLCTPSFKNKKFNMYITPISYFHSSSSIPQFPNFKRA